MGEAAKNISHDFKIKHIDIPWQKISGLRDKLIHFYFGIDSDLSNIIFWTAFQVKGKG